MKKKEWNEGLNHLDTDLVEKYVKQKDAFKQKKFSKKVWIRWGAVAACFCLVFGCIVFSGIMEFEDPYQDEAPNVDKKVLSLDDLINRTDYDEIIHVKSDDHTFENDSTKINCVNWKGIRLENKLYNEISHLDGNALIAITAQTIAEPEIPLSNYEYKGILYSEIQKQLETAQQIKNYLYLTKDFSNYYDENYEDISSDLDAFWDKVYGNVNKDFLHENKYVVENEFNVDAISTDLNYYESLCNQLSNDLQLCAKEYRNEYYPKVDLTKFVQKEVDVYEGKGTYIVVLQVSNMELFAEWVEEFYDAESIDDIMFRYATNVELGFSVADVPSDDTNDSDIDDVVDDVPIPEAPVADDYIPSN